MFNSLTNENTHLKAEDIDVQAVSLYPGVIVHDVDEDGCVANEADKEHH